MDLEKLIALIASIVLLASATGQLGALQKWIWRAQAQVVYQSRTSTWGSPRFFEPEASRETRESKPMESLR